jgi:hypothetical protein
VLLGDGSRGEDRNQPMHGGVYEWLVVLLESR